MTENIRELGRVKLVQIQPAGLIIERPRGDIYDESRRVVVEKLLITPLGIEATSPSGEQVLDIHHINHPDKAYGNDDLISIGFTSHYQAMRDRFGEHMVDGAAGENIIIEYDQEVWMDDLGEQIVIESAESGSKTGLDVLKFAAPCKEFSHYAARHQDKELPAAAFKDTLQFLNHGRRGFLLALRDEQKTAIVQAGDRVYAVHG